MKYTVDIEVHVEAEDAGEAVKQAWSRVQKNPAAFAAVVWDEDGHWKAAKNLVTGEDA